MVKKFYEDLNFLVSLGWSDSASGSGSYSYSLEPVTDYQLDYTHYEVDFYGAARRGSTWKGNRMVIE